MFNYTADELDTIDAQLEPLLTLAKINTTKAEQIAMDATRLLTMTAEQLDSNKKQAFFKRLWQVLYSNTTKKLNAATIQDLIYMQKMSWRYIDRLNERDLMTASSMITIKNNLMSLVIASEETRINISAIANKIAARFEQLEDRMKALEVQTNIHGWLITLETRDYDTKYTPMLRMLKVMQDFMQLKQANWNVNEIRYLQKAIKESGLDWKRNIKISEFIGELIEEIELSSFEQFQTLAMLRHHKTNEIISDSYVLENISAPSFKAMYKLANQHLYSSELIESLAEQLNTSKAKALQVALLKMIQKDGVDVNTVIPLRDLAVELLTCSGLAQRLYYIDMELIEQPSANTALKRTDETAFNHHEQAYIKLFLELFNDGEITEKERRFLIKECQQLGMTENRAKELENEYIKQQKQNVSDNEKIYVDDFLELLNGGHIGDNERRFLRRSRESLHISEQRAGELERLFVHVDAVLLTDNEKLYIKEIEYYLSDDGIIDDKERKLLNKTKEQLGLSEQCAAELEQHVLQNAKK